MPIYTRLRLTVPNTAQRSLNEFEA